MTRTTNATIDALWRMESPKIIGALARLVRDVGLAEELAQDALVAALQQWPEEGIPPKPAAWLMMTAKRRAIDRFRRDRMTREKNREVARDLDAREDVSTAMIEAHLDDDIGDERLALIFTACHPDLKPDARAALTLRLLGGLTPAEIGRAFLTAETTIQQRIVRAKKALRDAEATFEVPHGKARHKRLAAVLEVIYLIFNEGYSATSGPDWMRPQMCHEALRLGRILAGLMPEEAEALGLVALMELQASRLGARADKNGDPILLPDQNRQRWDQLLIRRGLAALDCAGAIAKGPGGPYQIQAAIAACHARASVPDDTDWLKIAALYAALMVQTPSPVIELNRAVAISMALGPENGLEIVDELMSEPSLKSYHLLPAVRSDLLAKLGRDAEASAEFERAAELAGNEREKFLLLGRAKASRDKLN